MTQRLDLAESVVVVCCRPSAVFVLAHRYAIASPSHVHVGRRALLHACCCCRPALLSAAARDSSPRPAASSPTPFWRRHHGRCCCCDHHHTRRARPPTPTLLIAPRRPHSTAHDIDAAIIHAHSPAAPRSSHALPSHDLLPDHVCLGHPTTPAAVQWSTNAQSMEWRASNALDARRWQ